MKNSKTWWNEVKNDKTKLNDWLVKQYRGEVTAADRILAFTDKYAEHDRNIATLKVIASQERMHAEWVKGLLDARGITPDLSGAEDKYWSKTLPDIESFETGAAVGAHAEAMRLERIRVIVADETSPKDIRAVFTLILKDEEFHERAFRNMASPEAMEKTKDSHELGMQLLGLEA